MACSTLLCSLAGAWTHNACKDGSIRSTVRPPGCRRVGCCGSSLSENRPCKQNQSVWSRSFSKRYCQDPALILEQRVLLLTMVVCCYIWRYIWKLATCQHVKSSTQGKVATAARSKQLLPHVGNDVPGCAGIARPRSESERRLAL